MAPSVPRSDRPLENPLGETTMECKWVRQSSAPEDRAEGPVSECAPALRRHELDKKRLRNEIASILRSRSWRYTAPLRRLVKWLHAMRLELEARYPEFRWAGESGVTTTLLGAAAITLAQPWSLDQIAGLHRSSLVVAFCMLDTISWHILELGQAGLEGVWTFAATHGDGFLYPSRYSLDQFRRRFPVRSDAVGTIAHLSLTMEEIAPGDVRGAAPGRGILLFGNSYEHKGLASTLEILREAFPLQPITVIGLDRKSVPGVEFVPTGQLARRDLHHRIAAAAFFALADRMLATANGSAWMRRESVLRAAEVDV